MFTPAEVRFLSGEHATHGFREMGIDPSTLNPATRERSLRVIQGVLEKRAQILGKQFAEFRGQTDRTLNAAELF